MLGHDTMTQHNDNLIQDDIDPYCQIRRHKVSIF